MVISSQRARVQHLRDTIEAYRAERADKLDKRARELLACLADSPAAAEAFERLRLEGRPAEACVLTGCIEADDIARTFPWLITRQKDVSVRAKRWEEAVAVLRRFFVEVDEQKGPLRVGFAGLDLWSLSVLEPPADNAALKNALDLIASFIEWRRGIAETNLVHLGATRDAGIKQAPENAAILILAARVYDATRKPPLPGKPHRKEVADLAQVILKTQISVERVREAQRKRKQLYIEMIGEQTRRHLRGKTVQAGRRDRS